MAWSNPLSPHWPSLVLVLSLHIAFCILVILHQQQAVVKSVELPHVLMATLITPAPNVKIQTPLLKNTAEKKPLHQITTSAPLATKISKISEIPVQQKSVAVEEPPLQEKQSAAESSVPTQIVLPRFDAAYLNNPSPEYPNTSRQLQEEGTVQLRVYVASDGKPKKIEIKNSSGFPRLDRAAQQAVRRWRFISAKQGEQAIAAWVIVPITFDLRN